MAQALKEFCAGCGGSVKGHYKNCLGCGLPQTSCACPENELMKRLEGRFA